MLRHRRSDLVATPEEEETAKYVLQFYPVHQWIFTNISRLEWISTQRISSLVAQTCRLDEQSFFVDCTYASSPADTLILWTTFAQQVQHTHRSEDCGIYVGICTHAQLCTCCPSRGKGNHENTPAKTTMKCNRNVNVTMRSVALSMPKPRREDCVIHNPTSTGMVDRL